MEQRTVLRWSTTFNHNFAASDGAGQQVSAGLDAIRWNLVITSSETGVSSETAMSLDTYHRGTITLDNNPNGSQETGGRLDFRFASGTLDNRHAFGTSGSHHDILGPQYGGPHRSRQVHRVAPETRRLGYHVTTLDPHFCSERFHPSGMQLDRSVADTTAARQRNSRLPATSEKRSKTADGSAHLAHLLVVCGGRSGIGHLKFYRSIRMDLVLGTQRLKDLQRKADIA